MAAWLAAHPEITVVSRDHGAGYGQAAPKGAPQATQVADCWHLMENASAAFLDAVRRSMKAEMLFSHFKCVLRLDRVRLRGPLSARDEFHLAAATQNLRKLAKLIPTSKPETSTA